MRLIYSAYIPITLPNIIKMAGIKSMDILHKMQQNNANFIEWS